MHFARIEKKKINYDYLWLVRLLIFNIDKWVRQLSKWHIIKLGIINYSVSDRHSSNSLKDKKSQKNIYEGFHSAFFPEWEENGQNVGKVVIARNLWKFILTIAVLATWFCMHVCIQQWFWCSYLFLITQMIILVCFMKSPWIREFLQMNFVILPFRKLRKDL